VYEWTAAGADGCEASSPGFSAKDAGCLRLISSGRSESDSHFLDASPSGRDVFFSTDERLVRWDTDNNYDLYDARIGGGFQEPPAATPECVGEQCQGNLAVPPTPSTFGSGGAVAGAETFPRQQRPGGPPKKQATPRQLLSKALKQCRKKHNKTQRKRCETQAYSHYKHAVAARKGSR